MLDELVDAYLAAKLAESEKSTLHCQINKFDSVLLPRLGHLRVNYLTPGKIDKFVADRIKEGRKLTTIRREIDDLLAVLNWSLCSTGPLIAAKK